MCFPRVVTPDDWAIHSYMNTTSGRFNAGSAVATDEMPKNHNRQVLLSNRMLLSFASRYRPPLVCTVRFLVAGERTGLS